MVTEKLLSEWTGLHGRSLTLFYLTYKKSASSLENNNDMIFLEQDIKQFLKKCKKKNNVSTLIDFWENKHHKK